MTSSALVTKMTEKIVVLSTCGAVLVVWAIAVVCSLVLRNKKKK